MPKYIDLTLPIDGAFRFKVDFKRDLSHEKDGAQATSFHISAHSFTHLDAPLHMVAKSKSIDVIPVDFFIGGAVLLDIPKGKNEAITAADMERAGKEAKDGDIVLIRTGWPEKMWGKEGMITSQDNLLSPRFYLAKGFEDWLPKTLKKWTATRPNWMI